jgi:hypothetical protein
MSDEEKIVGSYTCKYCGQPVRLLSNDAHMCEAMFNGKMLETQKNKNPVATTKKELVALGKKNMGWRIFRTALPELALEREFVKEWQEINTSDSSVNYGHGTLQDLFIGGGHPFAPFSPQYAVKKITPMDRMIVATIIQWLGSSIGFSFLKKVLNNGGYDIVPKKTDK